MKLVAPKLSYIEKTSFEECLKKNEISRCSY
jgi:hypothetical protein